MLSGLRSIRILLALVISLSVPVLSGYFHYCALADDGLFSPDHKFENPDLDDIFLLPDCQNHSDLFGSTKSNALFHVFLPEASAFVQLSVFSPQFSSFDQKNLVLRC